MKKVITALLGLSLLLPVVGFSENSSPAGSAKPQRSSKQKSTSTKTSETSASKKSKATTSTKRIGAKCRDGSTSAATGRGACSHHGGVAEWIQEKPKQ